MQLLSEVLENYLLTYRQLNGRAFNIGSVDQKSLLTGLPNFFLELLSKQGREGEFKVEGSIGNGNMPKVPWVGIFNKAVTETAQEGFYIVLLFSEDMKSCYLSLNQGVTELKDQYGQAIANSKMRAASQRALQFFTPDPDATVGPINLSASASLGKGYEHGAIESYRYDLVTLPPPSDAAENFLHLLSHYDRLLAVAGPSLQFLTPISEDEFHQIAMERAVTVNLDDDEPQEALPIPPKSTSSKNGYFRSVKYAAFALKRADFRCEIDSNHATFLSRARSHPYVEAHHLVPISRQDAYKVSLDVPANIVALCATCHKLLHHGRIIDKREHLIRLLNERHDRLEKMEILLDRKELLSYYSKDLLEDE